MTTRESLGWFRERRANWLGSPRGRIQPLTPPTSQETSLLLGGESSTLPARASASTTPSVSFTPIDKYETPPTAPGPAVVEKEKTPPTFVLRLESPRPRASSGSPTTAQPKTTTPHPTTPSLVLHLHNSDSKETKPVVPEPSAPALSSKSVPVVANAHRDRLIAFYTKHNPSKLASVDDTLTKFAGKEEELFRKLEAKYASSQFQPPPTHTNGPVCFLDVEQELNFSRRGRIVIELFAEQAPLAVENFRALCTGERGVGRSGQPLCFRQCQFHRIVAGMCLQGGDFTKGNGTGGESIYPPSQPGTSDMWGNFVDDPVGLQLAHNAAGLVSMANNGRNRNSSQFFITLKALPYLNGKHVVFGRVVSGMDLVEKLGTVTTDQANKPLQAVTISDCGELVDGKEVRAEIKASSGAANASAPFGVNPGSAAPSPFSSPASPFGQSSGGSIFGVAASSTVTTSGSSLFGSGAKVETPLSVAGMASASEKPVFGTTSVIGGQPDSSAAPIEEEKKPLFASGSKTPVFGSSSATGTDKPLFGQAAAPSGARSTEPVSFGSLASSSTTRLFGAPAANTDKDKATSFGSLASSPGSVFGSASSSTGTPFSFGGLASSGITSVFGGASKGSGETSIFGTKASTTLGGSVGKTSPSTLSFNFGQTASMFGQTAGTSGFGEMRGTDPVANKEDADASSSDTGDSESTGGYSSDDEREQNESSLPAFKFCKANLSPPDSATKEEEAVEGKVVDVGPTDTTVDSSNSVALPVAFGLTAAKSEGAGCSFSFGHATTSRPLSFGGLTSSKLSGTDAQLGGTTTSASKQHPAASHKSWTSGGVEGTVHDKVEYFEHLAESAHSTPERIALKHPRSAGGSPEKETENANKPQVTGVFGSASTGASLSFGGFAQTGNRSSLTFGDPSKPFSFGQASHFGGSNGSPGFTATAVQPKAPPLRAGNDDADEEDDSSYDPGTESDSSGGEPELREEEEEDEDEEESGADQPLRRAQTTDSETPHSLQPTNLGSLSLSSPPGADHGAASFSALAFQAGSSPSEAEASRSPLFGSTSTGKSSNVVQFGSSAASQSEPASFSALASSSSAGGIFGQASSKEGVTQSQKVGGEETSSPFFFGNTGSNPNAFYFGNAAGEKQSSGFTFANSFDQSSPMFSNFRASIDRGGAMGSSDDDSDDDS